ncbi:MAG: hypothetical protein JWQ40_2041 [Segetibacter sp.]|jgi:scyllo-inositol 2-dehydrogenase (NADP+)|nr:hypothetical protein [Segetibacter sp.]
MNTTIHTINAGIIGCDMKEDFFQTSLSNRMEKFYWKKIFVSNSTAEGIQKEYPNAEIVNNVEAIVNDSDITLVIVSATHLGFVKPIMQAGKSVRVI